MLLIYWILEPTVLRQYFREFLSVRLPFVWVGLFPLCNFIVFQMSHSELPGTASDGAAGGRQQNSVNEASEGAACSRGDLLMELDEYLVSYCPGENVWS